MPTGTGLAGAPPHPRSARTGLRVHHLVGFVLRRSPYLFFFQAEDGIRDRDVTGVQTCALPISSRPAAAILPALSPSRSAALSTRAPRPVLTRIAVRFMRPNSRRVRNARVSGARRRRSEERRVGKESRSRSSPQREKKTMAR